MTTRLITKQYWIIAFALALLIQACAAGNAAETRNVSATQEKAPLSETPLPENHVPTQTPEAAPPTSTEAPTPTLSIVKVTAVKGNLYIRRGPGMAYNPIGVLKKGESAYGLARDVLSTWIQINIPGQPDKTGWVSIQTDYSEVSGSVRDLPEYITTDWPIASYLRNCTHHQMIVQPGDTIIPSVFGYPDNEVWIYPGHYTVYDYDHPDQPEIMVVDLREGIEIDIREDGSGEKRKCP
jgi:hypothetical protein